MAPRIACSDSVHIVAEPLTQEAFAPFGDAIYNPRPRLHPSQAAHTSTPTSITSSLPPNASSANQGSAIKYSNVSRPRNLYGQAPSGRGEPVMSIFSCATVTPTSTPMPMLMSTHSPAPAPRLGTVPVRYLERHPFTTQTFTPVKSSASAYLVIVAPTLPATSQGVGGDPNKLHWDLDLDLDLDLEMPVPAGEGLPGRGMPDVRRLRAFVATGEQAVTYAAGTWHAPMMVLGGAGEVLDFVVFQFASGVAAEDCQLVELVGADESLPAHHPLVVTTGSSHQGDKSHKTRAGKL